MTMKLTSLLSVLVFLFLIACSSGNSGDWKSYNLLKYDLPVIVMAPDSVVIKSDNLMFQKDVTIEGALEEGYGVQIFSTDASSMDAGKIKAQQLADIKQHRYFGEVLKEEEHGFIYTTQLDSANTYHGFKYVVVKGGNEFVFQQMSARKYDLEQVEQMYNAVKGPKK